MNVDFALGRLRSVLVARGGEQFDSTRLNQREENPK
jgi:hypothetical protein